jgi:flagellar L-ring protein precursor FlgH
VRPQALRWLAAAVALSACAQVREGGLRLPRIDAPPEPVQPPAPPLELYEPAEASLWRGDESRRFLAFENRARRVGDVVTVLIDESATAQNQAKTELKRESSMNAQIDSDVGLQTIVSRPIIGLLRWLGFVDLRSDSTPTGPLNIVNATTQAEFDGDGKGSRQASFRTRVACVVTHVTPSGLLHLEGSRNLTINTETQVIRLAGYVRPEDVRIDNTIPSALIASADIEYTGVGTIADEQRVPWLARVFKWVLPF